MIKGLFPSSHFILKLISLVHFIQNIFEKEGVVKNEHPFSAHLSVHGEILFI